MPNNLSSWKEKEMSLFPDNELPFGTLTPQTFFVQQNKPSPMAPLQVWRGYKRNIYFQPISIQQITPTELTLTSSRNVRARASLPLSQPPSRARTAGQPTKPHSCVNSPSQVYILDKYSVLNSPSDRLEDELRFIEGVESTGSLAVRPVSSASQIIHCTRKSTERSNLYAKSKICKGTNFHTFKKAKINNGFSRSGPPSSATPDRRQFCLASASSADQKKATLKKDPQLLVSGGRLSSKYFVSNVGSNTKDSQYNYPRLTMNTPDLNGLYDISPYIDDVTDNQHELNPLDDNIIITDTRASRFPEEIKVLFDSTQTA